MQPQYLKNNFEPKNTISHVSGYKTMNTGYPVYLDDQYKYRHESNDICNLPNKYLTHRHDNTLEIFTPYTAGTPMSVQNPSHFGQTAMEWMSNSELRNEKEVEVQQHNRNHVRLYGV